MITRLWHGFIATVLCISFVCESQSQESRATDYIRPAEVVTTPKISPEESARRLQDAMLLFERGKTDAAIYMLQQLEKADPTNYKVLVKLGEMAISAKNWAYSIHVLRKASFLRPTDVEVRLILMDIYKAYQMPLQGIIVAKEILALDPIHIMASKRLAELYEGQAMLEDEIRIRQQLKALEPQDYENLKRLAVVFENSGELWEAARVYEQIRKYHPEKINDITRLAAIHGQLGHNFRELLVIDHLEAQGEKRRWLKSRARKGLRKENQIYDHFNAGLTFKDEEEDELDVFTASAEANYLHIRLRSSIDIGIEAKLSRLHHTGKGRLAGDMDINSATIAGKAMKNWHGEDYVLTARLGVLYDDVQGALHPAAPDSGITKEDFPFLKDPTFDSYGGALPIGGLVFQAKPGLHGLHSTYQIRYQHAQMEDLDARLFGFYFDKVALSYSFLGEDNTELMLQVDESFISDGNSRFHGLAGFDYMLLGSTPVHDYRGRLGLPVWRKSFFRKTPLHFLKLGYKFNYFNDSKTDTNNYEVFKQEKRHSYQLEAQTRIYGRGQGRNVFFAIKGLYSHGTTLDYQTMAGVKLFHSTDETEVGLSFDFEEEESTNISENLRIGGKTRSYTVIAFMKSQF